MDVRSIEPERQCDLAIPDVADDPRLVAFVLILLFVEGFSSQLLTVIVIAALYTVINLVAAGVWREMLSRVHVSSGTPRGVD